MGVKDTVVQLDTFRLRSVVRNNSVRTHAAMFSSQYSWCSPPSTALRRTR